MTYSIVARDPDTGEFGVAVASRFFAVGALVPHLRGGQCAVATQAFVSPIWGIQAADRLASGENGQKILSDFQARDRGHPQRQIHMVNAMGDVFAFTGAACIDWAGEASAKNVSVAGNMLAGPQVVAQTLEAYQDNATLPLAERLMNAMIAGEQAGGDKRGTQSAALVVNRGEDYPWLDLRADDHPSPLEEIRRLFDVAHERFVHVYPALPTRANFGGALDRAPIDAAIKAADEKRARLGLPSRSFATALGD